MDGIDSSPEGIEAIRELVIELRDEALAQNDFTWAVNLSHVVALLAQFRDIQKGANK